MAVGPPDTLGAEVRLVLPAQESPRARAPRVRSALVAVDFGVQYMVGA